MSEKIALIGYSFRFPNTDRASFWRDLLEGRNLVTQVASERWALDTYLHPDRAHPGTSYTFAAGSLGDVSRFDAGFFGISPREAAHMDPQQRLLLELAWEAFEHAGVRPSTVRGSSCGVFIGMSSVDYAWRYVDDLGMIDAATATSNTGSIAANRLSYVFDLHGPSMMIDTACSSSLVAFHQACRSILAGETEQALTGGISLHLHPFGFITFAKASMLSPRGRCNSFDAAGDGYVRSEGGGLFLLKDYDRAVADGDRILAVVASSTVNTDGHKSGMTVPSATLQGELLCRAYAQAGIDPGEIDYIEAHGTGTPVGDPIEAHALGTALGQQRRADQPLLIGSVKSNLGHLEPAAGVAGLVKSLLCIEHRMVPATAGIVSLNPMIDFAGLNLAVATKNLALKAQGRIVIGVNSFGFGGANAHVVLESCEACGAAPVPSRRSSSLPLLISAKDENALKAAASDLAAHLQANPRLDTYDLAYHAAFRREWLRHRAVVYGTTAAEYVQGLQAVVAEQANPAAAVTNTALEATAGPAFVYSGNGSQWHGMGRNLLGNPTFRATIREIDALFSQHADWSIEAELSGQTGVDRYEFTEFAQPTLFAIQVGITLMLKQLGIRPSAVAGHSVGEIAAAWACGALTLEAAVKVIYHRSQLQGTTKGLGQMTAVGLGSRQALETLEETGLAAVLSLAASNGPKGVTIAGAREPLDQLEEILSARGVFNRRLGLDYAFHSPAMDSLEAGLMHTLADLPLVPERIPYYSTVTGGRLAGDALGAEYWWHNIRKPVEFEAAIRQIIADGTTLFVEIGPHAILRGYINDCLRATETTGRVIATGNRGQDDPQAVIAAAGQIIIAGGSIDWTELFPQPGRFIDLPHYPWQRTHHWHPVTPEGYGLLYRSKVHPLLGYALPQQPLAWENQVDTLALPFLADHAVDDAVVFPGAGFAEMALAAARIWSQGNDLEIEDLEIRSPLLLSDKKSKAVRLRIDDGDGRLTISSRDFASGDAWNLNVVGRIVKEGPAGTLPGARLMLPDRQPDFTAREHYLLTAAVGLGYGPAFQAIAHGWVDGDSVTGILGTPAAIETGLESYHLHPALLDGCFQLVFQLLKELPGGDADCVFVPVRIGRLLWRGRGTVPRMARATLLRRAPHSFTAEFLLYDADGNEVAVLGQTRFRAIRVKSPGVQNRLDFLAYRTIPKPHAMADSAAAIPAARLQESLRAAVAEIHTEGLLHPYAKEVEPLLDALCSQFSREALELLAGRDAVIPRESFLELQDAHPDAAAFIGHILRTALADGSIEESTAGFRLSGQPENEPAARDIWNSLVDDYPAFFHITHAVGKTGRQLAAMVGNQPDRPTQPEANSLPQLMRNALGDDGKGLLDRAVQAMLSATLEQLPEGRRVRVVEISAGVPAFATAVCQCLDADRSDYLFVTPNPESLDKAHSLPESYPAAEVRLLDVNAPDPGEGERLRHDLAIVTCDFNTREAAMAALKFAADGLADNGLLLFLGQHPARWIDFVQGIRPAWWGVNAREDGTSTQQPAQFWKNLLTQCGISGCEQLDLATGTLSGPYLLLAQRASRVAAGDTAAPITGADNWLVVTDGSGDSATLAGLLTSALQERGATVRQVTPTVPGTFADELTRLCADQPPPRGIVHLAGWRAVAGNADPDAYLDLQTERCVLAREILKVSEALASPCWLVTSGAAFHLLARPATGADDTSLAGIADAALWGFGRTLANEVGEKLLRLVDFESGARPETAAGTLVRELLHPDDEQEVLITAGGERLVPRLRTEADPGETGTVLVEEDTPCYRLGFHMPGQLKNLRWEACPSVPPGEDEVEVEVKATGLNFRDFMYTLGLLSDEAVENGFVGPSLGLEFAGVVSRSGAGVNDVPAGTRVMGFGPASFGTRVTTKADAVAPMPQGLSFAEAATIPTAFFTVYYALHHLARLEKGEKVLIHGAAGGVGIAAIQVARWRGAEIYATAGTDEKRDFLRLLGVEQIFDSRSLDFAEEILAGTDGKGVDVVLNSLSGEAINRNMRILKPFGRFLELGKRDFYENTRLGLRPFRNNISYFGIDADQLLKERPELTARLFREIMELFRQGVFHPLPYTTFEANEVVDAFRHMQHSRQIGKIVVTYRNGVAGIQHGKRSTHPALSLPADTTFLVVGGLNGLGLKTAEWLAAKGTRNLVLISRGGPKTDEAREGIARLEQAGVKVHAAACDATDRQALAALLADISRSLPPLKGIIHSAMVIEDGLIRNLTDAQIRRVMAPKILGALHLHDLTRHLPLDYFIIYSSATTLFGNPGQGNYVAANFWLEALASRRKALGLPVTCIGLGAIDDAGYLARNEEIKEALQFLMGGSALTVATALSALESMLVNGVSGLGVVELDWRTLQRFLPRAGTPKFRDLARLAGDGGDHQDSGLDLKQMVAELSEPELLAAIIEMLKKEVGEVLRMPPEKIDDERSLYDIGLDSLMGVELAVAVESRFGIKLPAMIISENPNIRKLAQYFINQLRAVKAAGPAAENHVSMAQVQQVIGQHLPDADREDVVKLIRSQGNKK